MALTAKVNKLGGVNKDGNANKGTLSVYGLNSQFPVTLYANQWLELAAVMPAIAEMCKAGLADGSMAGPAQKAESGGRVNLAAYSKTK
jgi:hypothetical protein